MWIDLFKNNKLERHDVGASIIKMFESRLEKVNLELSVLNILLENKDIS